MLTFTEHIKHILNLVDKVLVNTQAEKFVLAADALMRISIHCNEAMQQLEEMFLKNQGKS